MDKGGRTKRISEEERGLTKLGHEVKLVTFEEPPDWVRQYYPASEQWVVTQKAGGFDTRFFRQLYKLVLDFQPDLIDAQCEGSALYAGIVSRMVGCKCVATIHRSELKYYQATWKVRFYYRFVDQIVAVSSQRKALVCRTLSMPEHRVRVVHWGIHISADEQPRERFEARSSLGLPDTPVLLSIGHLGPIKGHDDSISALPEILETHPGTHLYVAGDGEPEDYRRLEDHMQRLGVADNVTLLGQTGDVATWLQACDVFLQPSREEAFGLVFLEAGINRVATVATAVGGIPEIVIHNRTGILVPPRNPKEIATAVCRVLTDRNLALKMGEEARLHVIERYDLDKQIQSLAAYFRSLVGD